MIDVLYCKFSKECICTYKNYFIITIVGRINLLRMHDNNFTQVVFIDESVLV